MSDRVVFLGGIFLDNQISEIEAKSIGVVQNAADVLQKGFIRGLSGAFPSELTVVNLPFVNSYPRGYRNFQFKGCSDSVFESVRVIQKGWFNLEIVRIFFRFFAAYQGLKEAMDCRKGVIILYSAHLPFMMAAILFAKLTRGTKTCLILPDFPEFMGEGGVLYQIVKWVESKIFYTLAKQVGYFVVLTPFMAERLGISKSRFCVVEGIVQPNEKQISLPTPKVDSGSRIFLYTGTLARRYGILDLLIAFSQLETANVELWICGDGDSLFEVQEAAARDSRITYFGQVPRWRAVELQQCAHILVNPRPPNDEYTKYSFPSKTIEYLASARPIVMHHLPGMPSEYGSYIITPDSQDPLGLTSALKRAAGMPIERLQEIGDKGRAFVLREKTPVKQCEKVLKMLRMSCES